MSTGRLVSAIGAVALIAGSFLQWIELGLAAGLTRTGFDLALDVYVNWDEIGLADSFLISAGIVTVILGALGLIGAAASKAALARTGGILAAAAVILLTINVAGTTDLLVGYWVIAAGAVLLTLGGFLRWQSASSL
jgi:hypothetical protein